MMGICCSKDLIKEMHTNPASAIKKGLLKQGRKQQRMAAKEQENMVKIKASILIQKVFRVWISKLHARRELAWHIFQKVEYYGERNQMRLNRFFCVLIDAFSGDSSKHSKILRGQRESKRNLGMLEEIDELMPVPATAGVNISPPFSIENLNALMNFLKMGNTLHPACVINLLIMTTEKMKTKPNINEINIPITKKVTVVGDLHGSLDDLLIIFYKNNIPSLSNPYVFNGDIVDRGQKAVEVLMILCYCFLLYPNHVHFNRGNHEDPNMNEKYGFTKEVTSKYKEVKSKLDTLFKSLFRYMPFGSIIDRKIFVVHGGISDMTDLNTLSNIQRSLFHSIIKPLRSVVEENRSDWGQLMDILWSDPSDDDGCELNEVRGGGKLFGPDVTEQFLEDHKLELLIRSHQCKEDGYAYDHSDKVLTIFSASNYYHPGSNKGAYVVYTGDVKQIRVVQFISSSESLESITFKDNIVSMEGKAVKELKCMMCSHRHQLIQKFNDKDPGRTGAIPIEDYGNILSQVLGIKLPWRLVQPLISQKNDDNHIMYETSFEYTKEIQEESASEILFNNMAILETIFRALDRDNSGFITMEEFTDAIALLNKQSDIDIRADDNELWELLDIDKDGVIDISEFFEAFKISRT